MKIENKSLLRQQCFVGGKWINAEHEKTIEVFNPATQAVIGTDPHLGRADTAKAITFANNAWPQWRSKTGEERGAILRKWYELLLKNKNDLAIIMSSEQGKPLSESLGEVEYAASFLEWFAEEAKRLDGDVIASPQKDKRLFAIRQPVGVVAAITPWNFPYAMLTRKVGPALAAGCTVVAKPAKATPFSALALAVLAEEAGVPAGVFNVVTGDAKDIGAEFTENPIIRKISFTGSTEVGKLLMRGSADHVKKISLELGGNAPFIVFDDADIDAAVEGCIASKFRNTGQTCVCANRIYVQDAVYDEFAKKLMNKVSTLTVGAWDEKDVAQGPLINQAAFKKVQQHVEDVVKKGGKVLIGGKSHAKGGTFYEPTILSDVPDNALPACEETFGPVAPLYRFKSESDVIEKANNTPFGLAAYFYSGDMARIWRVAEAIESGMVGVNTGMISTAVAPFGGVKESGLGREGSKYGIEEYVEIKYIMLGGLEN
ncbi:MAG: NAD-dependent succinate-semialdehyde dehydrogenase [Alphaproteobacteria bacterium]|nr:NAD-dependent succinate-semialdehyde dehydrogenase [Alphaproteobacteria bacterium]